MVMSIITCVTFRAADDKIHSDISRNWGRIETVIPEGLTHGVIFDPKDAAVYMIGLRGVVDIDTIHGLIADLHVIRDERDNRQLVTDANCRQMPALHFESNGFGKIAKG
jgi:hypothetical protein